MLLFVIAWLCLALTARLAGASDSYRLAELAFAQFALFQWEIPVMDPFIARQLSIEARRRPGRRPVSQIGSVLVHNGKIIGHGHNRRVQQGKVHPCTARSDALEKCRAPAGIGVCRVQCCNPTLSAVCKMCSGGHSALRQFVKVIVGENQTFRVKGAIAGRTRGRSTRYLQDAECIQLDA